MQHMQPIKHETLLMMIRKMVQLAGLVLLGTMSVSAFKVSVQTPKVTVKQGSPFTVICTADNRYRSCTFRKGGKICEIEWNLYSSHVTMGQCDDFAGRVKFRGDYNSHECGLEIVNADIEDDGDWSCEFESNVLSFRQGTISSENFTVDVVIPTSASTRSMIKIGRAHV